ncbi:MAG: serine/threonine-protein kinase [Acidobacteriota bacterium]|nr:serine/threonine-protein kinase [Acidobacteriota bacterium]
MKKEDWQKVKEIFAVAVEQPVGLRTQFLREACSGDDFLRREVESLLEASDEPEQLIEKNAFDLASRFQNKSFAGKQFGNYQIIREIGRGGMGAVFLAARTDRQFEQQVAVKIIRQALADEEIERHFRRERQILASLNHPNIARLYDGGVSADGLPFFVMEYIEGEPLLEYAENRRLGVDERLNLFLQICSAVAFAHRNLIVHRDIKPSNILVDADGTPKLLDFGLAKTLDFEAEPNQAETVFRAFTPAYASPEQLRGQKVTTASDIYSLGVCLYELLTERRPYDFKTDSFEEIIHAVCDTAPIRPSQAITKRKKVQTQNEANPKLQIPNLKLLSGDLDNIILKTLRKEPERRYATVEQFAADIERYLKGLPVSARPATFAYRTRKFIERNKLAVAAVVLIILSLVGGLAISLWQAEIARAERDRAERRFRDVRHLSNALLFEIAPKIERLEGSTEARQVLVNQSLKYLDSLAGESADDSSLQSELASAYEKIGDLQGTPRKPNLSDFSGAISSYEKAQTIRTRLLEKNPNDWENRRALAGNHYELSNIRFWVGDMTGSLKESEAALNLYEKLVAERSDSIEARIEKAEAEIDLAGTLFYKQQYANTYAYLRPALAALEEIRRSDPENREILRLMGKAHALFGISLSWDNKQEEGEAEMRRALEINESLVEKNPNDVILRNGLWATYMQASSLYEGIKDDLSRDFAMKSLNLAAETVKKDPLNTQAKQNLGQSYSKLAASSIHSKKFSEAVEYAEKALSIYTELERNEPQNLTYKRNLALAYTRLGDAKHQLRDLPEALKNFETALSNLEKIVQSDAQATVSLRDIALACKNIGWIHEDFAEITGGQTREKHLQAAKQNYQRALDILRKLKDEKSFAEFDNKFLEEMQTAVEKYEKKR